MQDIPSGSTEACLELRQTLVGRGFEGVTRVMSVLQADVAGQAEIVVFTDGAGHEVGSVRG